jgi:cytochrome c oxidase cbb3-type subunit III
MTQDHQEKSGLDSEAENPVQNIDEHNYDGIKELDNPPPGWIMAVFYLTIGISILYGAYYFWLKVGDQQETEYTKAVQIAQQKMESATPAVALSLLTDESSLAEGKSIFTAMNCTTCHGLSGEGNAIGPNLTDNYWLLGCKFDVVFNTIKNGFPTKGMTAFKGQLSDEKIQRVASFVLSLKGSNPPNAKAPQGEACQ